MELGDIALIIQDLLDNPELDDLLDVALLRHLLEVVNSLAGITEPVDESILPVGDSQMVYIADVIRARVEEKTKYAVRTKVWGVALDDEHVLTVASNELVKQIPKKGGSNKDEVQPELHDSYMDRVEDDEDKSKLDLPKLQIEYEDRVSGTVYIFSRNQNDEVRLDTMLEGEGDSPSLVLDNDDAEQMVADFLEELDDGVPGRYAVGLITSKLLEGCLIDAE